MCLKGDALSLSSRVCVCVCKAYTQLDTFKTDNPRCELEYYTVCLTIERSQSSLSHFQLGLTRSPLSHLATRVKHTHAQEWSSLSVSVLASRIRKISAWERIAPSVLSVE